MATHEHTDIVVVVEEADEIGLAELAELSGLNAESLQELALAGCLGSVRGAEAEWSFGSRSTRHRAPRDGACRPISGSTRMHWC
ncbi:MAG: hypothetical protein MZW92_76740 [Comamonadaceae bacterium]|nr:hypothetical protein [Comamonadaceae bacterium]